ncbi:MAG TPA: HypC/HybG/HupF family hydrogenase formation chaperone [Phycisphaerales bacterium]|nr:HypC/HybG/HupF family hydrogenase formation chaperone [Phycisphaerales bacterium]
MCLAIPGRIEWMKGRSAGVVMGGNRTEVMADLIPQAKVGDWVLVHAGVAITVLNAEEARMTYNLLDEMSQLENKGPAPQ